MKTSTQNDNELKLKTASDDKIQMKLQELIDKITQKTFGFTTLRFQGASLSSKFIYSPKKP